MNDPHVAALLYRIEHSSTFNYEKARPRECDLAGFQIRIETDQATAEPKQHFATAEEARGVVEPLLRAWELEAALTHDSPDVLRFVYLRSEIIDRNPPQGSVLHTQTGHIRISDQDLNIRMDLEEYPSPPSGLAIEPGSEVEAMFAEWRRYKKGGWPGLGHTANFCLTALEGQEKQKRKKAAEKFRISKRVLDRLGQLAERERKYKGYGVPYTGTERTWLEAVLKKIIRRAAEVAYDPDAERGLITMDDLPPL